MTSLVFYHIYFSFDDVMVFPQQDIPALPTGFDFQVFSFNFDVGFFMIP